MSLSQIVKIRKSLSQMNKTGKAFLKQDFISILEWYRNNNLIHPVFENSLSNTIEFYANKYDETFTYLNKVSEKYTFENCENVQLYKEELKPYSRIDEQFIVSLATNIGENDIVILLNKCGSITGIDKELGQLKLGNSGIKNNESNKVFANTEIFPIKYFRKLEGVKSEIERTFYFTFLSYIWQEVNGNKNGSLTSTNENNSCNKFFMNDFSYDDFSVFQEDDCIPKFVNEYFNRKLTTEELFIRAKFTPYPLNPYENNYRYFEKNDEFVELILLPIASVCVLTNRNAN